MNSQRSVLLDRIYRLPNEDFDSLALDIFQYQADNNLIYHDYLMHLNVDTRSIEQVSQIPCIPIQFFKTASIQSGEWKPLMVFESSGTSGQVTSKHALRDLNVYKTLSFKAFAEVYGPVKDWCFLALLPHYLERKASSLVQMVKMFIEASAYDQSGFYLNNTKDLIQQIKKNQVSKVPTILIGVSFALIDLIEAHDVDLSGIVIMETGGMKGRRAEWDKSTLHRFLVDNLHVDLIHSEYGMTELISQCYSTGNGLFKHSPSLQLIIKEVADPFSEVPAGKSGVINAIDLGNIDTCSFIETQDLGMKVDELHFQIQGRLDNSDIRGCNLMVL